MIDSTRRQFLAAAALGAATSVLAPAGMPAMHAPPKRKMTISLSCGSIGVKATQPEAIELAHRHGFDAVAADAEYLARLDDGELVRVVDGLRAKGLVWGAAGLPVEFRRDESTFREGLKKLPVSAAAMQRAGVTRLGTYIRSSHSELTYLANFKLHATRLREVARVLGEHRVRFGLEYVGPKTSWSSTRHPFVHSLAECRELIAEINVPGVGVVVDSWHWYTAGETEADLLSLKADEVVCGDLNDAPVGITIDKQMDHSRELPAATGVIDVKTFLAALDKIGFDGPLRAEPFNAELRKLPPDEAVAATAKAMKRAFAM